jgi:hypothetical protein
LSEYDSEIANGPWLPFWHPQPLLISPAQEAARPASQGRGTQLLQFSTASAPATTLYDWQDEGEGARTVPRPQPRTSPSSPQ